MKLTIIISILLALSGAVYFFRSKITGYLLYVRSKLHMLNLRFAANEAEIDKKKTGRKNMVVFNQASGDFESIQKKFIKAVMNNTKQKNNGKQTEGRKKFAKLVQKRKFTADTVKQIEKKSLYVTD